MLYGLLEILYRGYTHLSMGVLGGICFLLIGRMNNNPNNVPSILSQMLLSCLIITSFEFTTGVIVNLWMNLKVWDYSMLPLNICGQICLYFSFIWFFISPIAIYLEDFLRWKLFKEEMPQFKIKF